VNDLTLLYYTANRINEQFARAVRAELVESCKRFYPTMPNCIVISHQPIGLMDGDEGIGDEHIVVGDVPQSIYRVYQNVLIGAKAATTPFVACCEDDTVYHPWHFLFRPALDTFAYDRSRWVITRKLSADGRRREAFYYWRERTQMAMCIAPRALLIEALEEKFAKYPVPPPSTDVAKKAGWGEPGRYETNLKLTPRRREYFDPGGPSVTFNHSESLMGRRRVNPDDIIKTDLEYWGNADALWQRIYG